MEEAWKPERMGIKPLLRALSGQHDAIPPVWMMRQAGRYLPEYRAVREKAGGFLDLCFNPELAAEVTLQPVKRFGFDAAILFSDILIVPLALGRKVEFLVGEGPKLEPLADAAAVAGLHDTIDGKVLAPIYETVSRVKSALDDRTTLIGFCGAPWTVATYMVAGEATPDQAPARLFAYRDPAAFAVLGAVFSSNGSYASGRDYVSGLVPAVAVGAAVVAVGAVTALALPRRKRIQSSVDAADVPVLLGEPAEPVYS